MIKKNGVQLLNLFKEFLPQGKHEIILFIFLILLYLPFSLYFGINTMITDDPYALLDLYFSFDNNLYYHSNPPLNFVHPLYSLFTTPILYAGVILSILIGYKAKTLLIILLMETLVCLSVIYINRYLKKVIELNKYVSLMLTLFFAVFATNIFLSFTFETYTFSLFFLSFALYYYSSNIKNKTVVPFSNSLVLSCILGGITITNFSKGIINLFFENNKAKFWNILKIGIIFGIIVIIVAIKSDFMVLITSKASTSITGYSNSIFEVFFCKFGGAPILLPAAFVEKLYYFDIDIINLGQYEYIWQYIFVGVLYGLVLLAVILNYRNRLVLMACSYFLIDIIIHIVIQYGRLDDLFIYGGHWVFLIPVFLGWLFKKLNSTQTKYVSVLIIIMTIVLFANNLINLIDFARLATQLFPAS